MSRGAFSIMLSDRLRSRRRRSLTRGPSRWALWIVGLVMVAMAILYAVFVNKLGILIVPVVISMALGVGHRMRHESRRYPRIPL